MQKKYQNYTVSDFTQDNKFVDWVRKGIHSQEWKRFVDDNPQLKSEIDSARKIITLLESTPSTFPGEDTYSSWKAIEHFFDLYQNKKKKNKIRGFYRYAAVFLLALTIGATIPYIYFNTINYSFSEIDVSDSQSDETRLVLADGNVVYLKEDETALNYNAGGNEIKINNDSIVKQDIESKMKDIQMNEVIIPFGKRSTLTLCDGTKVWLNAGSKLSFPPSFKGKYRKVYLSGEGYFEVAKNKNFPFVVNTREIDVTVLGTEFCFRNNESDSDVEVVLVNGSVSLKENSFLNILQKEVKLIPNQRFIFNKEDKTNKIDSNVDVSYFISWKEGLLEFDKESIFNVFRRLSRYYNVKISAEKSVELNTKISGKLDLKESLTDVLKVISDAAPIGYKIEEDKVFIYKKLDF